MKQWEIRIYRKNLDSPEKHTFFNEEIARRAFAEITATGNISKVDLVEVTEQNDSEGEI